MSCNPERPAFLNNPILDQLAVQNLQQLFEAELPWLDVVYPIARIGVTKLEGGDVFSYPQVYSGSGAEYLDIRPDDSLGAYCFFEINNAPSPDNDGEDTIYNISIVVWFNLPKLNGSKGYDFSRELAGHMVKVLSDSLYEIEITELEFNPENIFDKYSFKQEDTQLIMYPYGAFKLTVDFSQLDDINCYDVFPTGVNGCEN